MFSIINDVLQSAADVLAPPPTALQDFTYHWKQVKCFYAKDTSGGSHHHNVAAGGAAGVATNVTSGGGGLSHPKCHINDTNIPFHLEEMLKIIIDEEVSNNNYVMPQSIVVADNQNQIQTTLSSQQPPAVAPVTTSAILPLQIPQQEIKSECLEFVLETRLLDLLTEFAVSDCPPGATFTILNWMRRFLSCLRNPFLNEDSIFQPVQKLIGICNGAKVSPYETEEILFLSTVAGLIRKEPFLINLFLPAHQHSAYVNTKNRTTKKFIKLPVKNSLFDCGEKMEANIRRVAIVHEEATTTTTTVGVDVSDQQEDHAGGIGNVQSSIPPMMVRSDSQVTSSGGGGCGGGASSTCSVIGSSGDGGDFGDNIQYSCDCDKDDRFRLLDAILEYFDSPDSIVIVRACEGALILSSLPSVTGECNAVKSSLTAFSIKVANRVAHLCQQIPEDMDTGDIEDCSVSWGLMPRDTSQPYFVGRGQLQEFLCWLDYSSCLSAECSEMANDLCYYMRKQLLENCVEPVMLDANAAFMLVLAAKIIHQLRSRVYSNELANWLIGDGENDDISSDCLLNILIENAQDNTDILLPTLQFIESLLDNANERILNGMLFRYLNTRGYYDGSAQKVQTWSDEEDERDKRRGSADGPIHSKTLAPNNILKVINNFLLLLPRQIMSETIGTCYEEYVQDASRHYQNWIARTSEFHWPIEAIFLTKLDDGGSAYGNDNDEFCGGGGGSGSGVNPKGGEIMLPQMNHHHHHHHHHNNQQHGNDSGISEETFYEGPLLRLLFQHVRHMATHPYELNLAVIAILSKLAFLPHPYLHEVLLNPEIPIARGTHTLWSSMQLLARHLLLEVPRIEGFQQRVAETAKRLLTNPPMMNESSTTEENDQLFEALVVLEEFCKELAAIAFVKYHHATE